MAKPNQKRITLALQGGGSHGALTWGVLDRILEDERLEIAAISGTSAGAMNAVVLVDGLHRAGRAGARRALEDFWRAVSDIARLSPVQRSLWDRLTGSFSLDSSPGYFFFDHLTRLFSPYQLNPFDINPLRDLLRATIDFDCVNRCRELNVYVTATNVRTGRAHIFTQPKLSVETIMSSACLPYLYAAVEIDGEAYWDGGYMGNPALYPLVDDTDCRDIVIVQINPMVRQRLPVTGREIQNRINEITFNGSLIKELRTIQLLHQLIEAENLEVERYRDMRVHLIHTDEEIQDLHASSKLNAEWKYLTYLHERGRDWADKWLDTHYEAVGEHSTLDLKELFADAFRPVAVERRPRTKQAG